MSGVLSGKDGAVKAGASPSAVGEVQEWTYDEESDSIEYYSMGDTERSYLGTVKGGGGTIKVLWDEDDAGQALFLTGTVIALELYTDETSGFTKFTGNGLIASKGISVAKDSMVERSYTFKATLTEAAVPV